MTCSLGIPVTSERFSLLLSGCHLVQRVSYRQIGEADIPNIATLLVRGFPKRNREFWLRALGQLSRRQPPWGLPKYGYVLESDEQAVGVVLVISSASRTNNMVSARCNLSSWYVEPQYRSYAVHRSRRHCCSAVTYLNISADQAHLAHYRSTRFFALLRRYIHSGADVERIAQQRPTGRSTGSRETQRSTSILMTRRSC